MKMKRICITEKQYDEVLDTLYKDTRFVSHDDDCVDDGLFWMHPADIGTDSFDFGILEACITDRNVFPIVFIRKNGNIGYVKVFYNPVFVGCDFLNEEEVNFIYDIVSENVETLYLIAHGDQFVLDGDTNFQKTMHFDRVDESPQLPEKYTGIKTSLWLDTNGSYKKGGHGKRIKFKADDSTDSSTYATMTISDNPNIIGDMSGSNLSSKEIRKVSDFVRNNRHLLSSLSDSEIGLYTDFIPNAITFDKNGKPFSRTSSRSYDVVDDSESFGFKTVKSVDGLFNFINKEGDVVSNVWFDTVIRFDRYGSEICGRGCIWKYWYNVYPNGRISYIGKH